MLKKLGFNKTAKKDGYIPGDQSKITTPIKKGISDAKAYVKPQLKKVKAFSKDYASGNQGYLPGNQTKLKASVKKTYGKVKAFAKDYASGSQTKLKADTKIPYERLVALNSLKTPKKVRSSGGDYSLEFKSVKKYSDSSKNTVNYEWFHPKTKA